MADQELNVKITGDASGLTKATSTAAQQLEGLQKDVQALDNEQIEITPQMQLSRINRDTANLKKVLDGIERRKAEPDVGLDLVQLTRDEAKVKRAISDLEAQQIEIDASIDVTETMTTVGSLGRGALSGLAQGAISSGLSAMPGKLSAIGGAARTAAPMLEEAGVAMGGIGAAATGVGIVVAIPIAAGILTDFGFKAASAAADVESLKIQLDALTGNKGEESLAFLQQWAKETPFTLDQAIQSFKLLVAAGVPLKDIPADLNSIGSVSAALGTDLGSLTLPLSQMISSGKASYENIQQLVELSGVPAWSILADNLGLTVGEVQKLASEGKLGADAVQLLIDQMGAKFPTALADQSESLNGQLSSLQDTMTQTKQTISSAFLPAMEAITPALQDMADIIADLAVIWVAAVQKIADQPITKAAFVPLEVGIKTLHLVKVGADQLADSVDGAGDSTDTFGGKANSAADDVDLAASAITQAVPTVEDYTKALQDAATAFSSIGGDVRTKVSFIIDQAGLEQDIRDAVKGTGDTKGVSLPAHLTIAGIDDLGDTQTELISNISSFAEQGLEEGARRSQLNPEFDEQAWYNQVRSKTKGLLIEAGIDPKAANRVLNAFIGLPRSTKVGTTITGLDAAGKTLAGFTGKTRRVPVVPYINEKAARAAAGRSNIFQSIMTGASAAPKPAPIAPSVVPGAAAASTGTLNSVAMPGGQPRDAHIKAAVDNASLANVRTALDDLAKDRYSTIFVNTVKTGGGGGGGGGGGAGAGTQSIVPQLFPAPGETGTQSLTVAGRALAAPFVSAAQTPMTATYGVPGAAQPREQGTVTQLMPRQVPIKVYLDGAEIADALTLKSGRMATSTTLRRRA